MYHVCTFYSCLKSFWNCSFSCFSFTQRRSIPSRYSILLARDFTVIVITAFVKVQLIAEVKEMEKSPSTTNELNSTLINFSGFVVVTLIWHNEGIHGNNMNCSWPPQLFYYSVNKGITGLWVIRSSGQEMVIKVLARGMIDPVCSFLVRRLLPGIIGMAIIKLRLK